MSKLSPDMLTLKRLLLEYAETLRHNEARENAAKTCTHEGDRPCQECVEVELEKLKEIERLQARAEWLQFEAERSQSDTDRPD